MKIRVPNFMKKLIPIFIASTLISGCASHTYSKHELPINNNKVVFPPLKVISDNQYEWDTTISEALNIAKLAQPAGVGNDMRDATDGKTVKINRNDSGNRLLEGVIGFASGGVMGAMSSDNLNRINNELVEWKPTIVEIVDKETVLVDGQIDFRNVRNMLAEKIKKAISVNYPDIQWGESLTYKGKDYNPMLAQTYNNNDLCQSIREHDALSKKNVKPNLQNLKNLFYDGEEKVAPICFIAFDIRATKETTEGKIALVAEMERGFMLADALAKNYDGYVMVPDIYFINSAEKIIRDYAYVSKNGKELLFEKP